MSVDEGKAKRRHGPKPVLRPLRQELALREELEDRQVAEKYQRRLAGLEPPSTSVHETFKCQNAHCGAWTRPSLSRDGDSCEQCQTPRHGGLAAAAAA